jgi:hypothetical protein
VSRLLSSYLQCLTRNAKRADEPLNNAAVVKLVAALRNKIPQGAEDTLVKVFTGANVQARQSIPSVKDAGSTVLGARPGLTLKAVIDVLPGPDDIKLIKPITV